MDEATLTTIAEEFEKLPEAAKYFVKHRLEGNAKQMQREVFASEFAQHLNTERAAEVSGMPRAALHNEKTRALVVQKLQDREKVSKLKAEYVREYLLSILELCPGDWCQPYDGGWFMTREQYERLPHEVKRLIQNIEVHDGYFVVEFISKSQALSLAARYTLAQKFDIRTEGAFPWDELIKPPPEQDEVEAAIAAVRPAAQENAA